MSSISSRDHLIRVANGKEPAELVLRNARVFLGFDGKFCQGDLAIADGHIAGFGHYHGHQEIDLNGKYITPGFIDAHVHIESMMLTPAGFAQALLPQGITTVIADPHEIANVAGTAGIQYMLDASENLPMNIHFMMPSCVPASPLDDSGAILTAKDLQPFMEHPRVLGLAEVMDVPDVLNGNAAMRDKLDLTGPQHRTDGHAPGLMGKALMAYAAAGIQSDHECVTPEEAKARLQAGMYLLIREGSAAKNLKALLPVINERNSQFCCFCTDDRHPADLIQEGSINAMVRMAIAAGIPVWQAIQMASLNTARYFGLEDTGVIAPGRRADLLVFDDLTNWHPTQVYSAGQLVAQQGQLTIELAASVQPPAPLCHSVHLAPVCREDLAIPLTAPTANVIGLIPQQLLTHWQKRAVPIRNGQAVAAPEQDILKLAVFERHHGTGRHGTALVSGFGLKAGAIAQTIGHDSHNLIVIGASDRDMLIAIEALRQCNGGVAIAVDGQLLSHQPLPVAGLMTNEPMDHVAAQIDRMYEQACELGVKHDFDPFITLAFLSLPVIPELKLTDQGLIDTMHAAIISCQADQLPERS